VSKPPNPGRLVDPRVSRTAISFGAWYLDATLAVRCTFLARCVVVDPARCLALLEGRIAPQSVRIGSLRRGTLFRTRGQLRCLASPSTSRRERYIAANKKRLCNVTEVTELSFRRKILTHRPWVPAAKPRPSPRPPCGSDGYSLPFVVVGSFPRLWWYFSWLVRGS
jgi:hypothetical protein